MQKLGCSKQKSGLPYWVLSNLVSPRYLMPCWGQIASAVGLAFSLRLSLGFSLERSVERI